MVKMNFYFILSSNSMDLNFILLLIFPKLVCNTNSPYIIVNNNNSFHFNLG